MKHYIIFITMFSLSCAIAHAMENIQKYEKRSLRDELLCMHTLQKQFNIPTDASLSILYKSYLLRDINTVTFTCGKIDTTLPKKKLNFCLLDNNYKNKEDEKHAVIDFLYLTNKQEMIFLTMEPFIIKRDNIWYINIVKTDENHANYLTLPKHIQDLDWWFIKEYED